MHGKDGKLNMYELIPSKTMRKYLKSVNFEFDDFESATLIWNAPDKMWEEKLDEIKKRADTTKNEVLKKQINERIQFEKKEFDVFQDNTSEDFIYMTEDGEDESCSGIFAEYVKAYNYSLKYIENYEISCMVIKKYRIVRTSEDEVVRRAERGNPYMGFEVPKFGEYDGTEVSGISINKKGKVIRIWSNELAKEEEERVSSFRPERFEYPFIKIPFDIQIGSIVKDITTGTYGVLSQGKKEWDDYLKRIEEKNWYVDFSDIQVIVYELTEKGYWSHYHVNPLYLEMESPTVIPEDEENQAWINAMRALGSYLRNISEGISSNGQSVIQAAKRYAAIRRRKNKWNIILDEAVKPEDIMY